MRLGGSGRIIATGLCAREREYVFTDPGTTQGKNTPQQSKTNPLANSEEKVMGERVLECLVAVSWILLLLLGVVLGIVLNHYHPELTYWLFRTL